MTNQDTNIVSLQQHIEKLFELRDKTNEALFKANEKHLDALNNSAAKMLEMQKESGVMVTRLTTQLIDKAQQNESNIAVLNARIDNLSNGIKAIVVALIVALIGYALSHLFGGKS